MALPPPPQVAGNHIAIFEAYYSVVDPNNCGQIGAIDAAKFLKKSNLSDIILSKIWDLSDPGSRGFLDKPGMFVALKLCALAQQGHSLSMANILMEIAPPNMGELPDPKKMKPRQSVPVLPESQTSWAINPLERAKYKQLFMSLEPIDGYIPGNKVKGVLMDSKLPLEVLGKIWDLADIDKDGKLNEHEFIVAMHLVYKALEKNTVPNVLPMELQEPNISHAAPVIPPIIDPKFKAQPGFVAPANLPDIAPAPLREDPNKWVVSDDDRRAAEKLFIQADADCDGFVSGAEIRDIFLQSKLPQPVLAQIWGLCDIFQQGKLNKEQFSLSMWLIKQKLNKHEIPAKLTPEMIPPSMRKSVNLDSEVENNNACNVANTNPECELIGQEINSIVREKQLLEKDLSQKDADIKIKTGEIKSLQSELDTLAATLRQLDNQKGEAQKRLNDLRLQIDKLRQQATDQEATLKVQEDEISSKRQELESLKLQEQNLESQQLEFKNQLVELSKTQQDSQLKSSQIKAQMTQLEEQQRQILDALTQYDSAFAMGDASVVPESTLFLKINLDEYMYNIDDISRENKDTINNNSNEDDQTGFKDNNQINTQVEDPFESAFSPAAQPKENYDPFNDKKSNQSTTPAASQVHDPFGEDPFAALHAPVRATSPSPALPPKKIKQPPPRPAPPRPSQAPSPAPDPFLDKTNTSKPSGGAGFDFADFDNFQAKIE